MCSGAVTDSGVRSRPVRASSMSPSLPSPIFNRTSVSVPRYSTWRRLCSVATVPRKPYGGRRCQRGKISFPESGTRGGEEVARGKERSEAAHTRAGHRRSGAAYRAVIRCVTEGGPGPSPCSNTLLPLGGMGISGAERDSNPQAGAAFGRLLRTGPGRPCPAAISEMPGRGRRRRRPGIDVPLTGDYPRHSGRWPRYPWAGPLPPCRVRRTASAVPRPPYRARRHRTDAGHRSGDVRPHPENAMSHAPPRDGPIEDRFRARLRRRPPLRRGTGAGRHHPPAPPLGTTHGNRKAPHVRRPR